MCGIGPCESTGSVCCHVCSVFLCVVGTNIYIVHPIPPDPTPPPFPKPHVSHRYQRSIGTASVKLESLHAAVGGVICDPEITEIDLDAHTGPMLLLGCDGVWDHFAEGRDGKARRPAVFNKLLFTAYAKHSALPMPTRLTRVAETLVARALTWDRNTSHDNTSILLVHLPS